MAPFERPFFFPLIALLVAQTPIRNCAPPAPALDVHAV